MKQKILSVDQYFTEGCGRCEKGATADCKIHRWPEVLRELRRVVQQSGMDEVLKWSMPTYIHNGKNVVIVSAFKEFCSINFFKGALLNDPEGHLVKAGENTHAARLIKFTDVSDVIAQESLITRFLKEAMAVEDAGLSVDTSARTDEPVPLELHAVLDQDRVLKDAWEALTPGRQRGYLLHFNGAKQSRTKTARIEKCRDKILEGLGWNGR